jgi:hypothetical protein
MVLVSILVPCSNAESRPAKPKITAEVAGVAKVITSGILEVGGKMISLVGIQDLDEPPSHCTYLDRYLPPGDSSTRTVGPAKLPPSLDTVENRSYCSPRTLGKNYLCSISMTAADQFRELKKLAAGKRVRCDYVGEDQMNALWDDGYYVSKYGYKFHPGECYLGDKSIGAELIRTGWAGPELGRWKQVEPVDPSKELKRGALKEALNAREAGAEGYPRVKSHRVCNNDREWRKYPERYSPKPAK